MAESPKSITQAMHYQSMKAQSSQKQVQGQRSNQVNKGTQATFLYCYPRDFYSLLFGFMMVVSAVISIFDFFRTGNTSMLMTLCYMTAGHTGLQMGKNLLKSSLTKQPPEA